MFRERIEAVTVCIGYADFLAEVAPWNRPHFDRWLIVTTEKDTETREVARHFRLSTLVTNDSDRDGPFSKGRLIERGLQQLSSDGWVMHIDGDIALTSTFRHDLERAHLRKEAIYGFDRVMVKGAESWDNLAKSGWLMNPRTWHPHGIGAPPGYEIGSRWAGSDGYVPIGYAQFWHRTGGGEEWRGARAKPYPHHHGTACRGDVQFGLQWDRQDRVLIPEILCAHIEPEGVTEGANWKGRKTPKFRG